MNFLFSSRKQPKDPRQARGRKGLEEAEKQLTGAGWTTAATTHFMELELPLDIFFNGFYFQK